jgi:flagellar biosynthetic protein FliP
MRRCSLRFVRLGLPLLFLIHAPAARAVVTRAAEPTGPLDLIGVTAGGAGHGVALSAPLQIALGLTLLSLLPAVLMCITPFLRISIVLHFLRQALGTQTAPSNQVLAGLALFLSLLIVQPVFAEMYSRSWEPLEKGQIGAAQAFEQGAAPLRTFMLRFARERDIQLFVEIGHAPPPRHASDLSLKILIPAYILSELKTGFQIGAVLFLPFLVIDIAVASVTLSIGMMQLPPAMISAPFKILLFVLVDGWNLVVGSLMKTFLGS